MVSIDPNWRSYKIRLTRGWARAISNKSARSGALADIVLGLIHDLRAVELTASMAHTLIGQLDKFVEGYIRGSGETTAQQAARFIAARLVGRVNIRDEKVREDLLAECLQISTEVKAVRSVPGFSSEDLWKEYLALPGFKLALSASQSLGIGATYNAYEHFIVRCVRTALVMDRFRKKSDENFAQKISEAFGEEVRDTCFLDDQVKMTRALRHAISHNGGRVTQELIDLNHPFNLVNDYIQFMPEHLETALRIIERCVNQVVDAAVVHPVFAGKRK